ncbi:hypothetical protein [Sphingomonas sp. IW22]|uniref:hypothetical protein n=1 Tax=Sphingomonas sp. IW22 TaxID=3242489 RepID=UPI0035213037
MTVATKADLRGAFLSLSQTLAAMADPSHPEDVANRRLAVSARIAAAGRRATDWNALPPASDAFEPVIAGLDAATRALAVADEPAEHLRALDRADEALLRLEQVLNSAGEDVGD